MATRINDNGPGDVTVRYPTNRPGKSPPGSRAKPKPPPMERVWGGRSAPAGPWLSRLLDWMLSKGWIKG